MAAAILQPISQPNSASQSPFARMGITAASASNAPPDDHQPIEAYELQILQRFAPRLLKSLQQD
jgi:hypothetical protein